MSVNGIERSAGLFGPAASTAADIASTQEDQDMFLELMVAQLRYQDPMNPADSGEFLTQNATFTMLQTMQTVSDQTAMLVSAQLAFGAAQMTGQQVQWYDADGSSRTGVVSSASFQATGPVLRLTDGTEVPMTSVVTVAEPGTTLDDLPPLTTGDETATQSSTQTTTA